MRARIPSRAEPRVGTVPWRCREFEQLHDRVSYCCPVHRAPIAGALKNWRSTWEASRSRTRARPKKFDSLLHTVGLTSSTLAGHPVLFGTFEPGWKWSDDVKPIAQTDSCQADHLIYCVSGRMGIRMNDGAEGEIGPGDVVSIAPGHDAWVVGDEPCISVDFGGYAQYAKR